MRLCRMPENSRRSVHISPAEAGAKNESCSPALIGVKRQEKRILSTCADWREETGKTGNYSRKETETI